MTLEMFVGNRSPSLTGTITVNGAPFDLSGSTVKLQMRLASGSVLKVDSPATIVNAVAGQVQYNWAALDVDTQGDYAAWWRVTLPNTLVQDSPEFEVAIAAHDATGLTLDEIREHVETGLVDDALERLLVEAQAQVTARAKSDASLTVSVEAYGRYIRLQRPALSITSIAEFNDQRYPLYTLLPADYELQYGGRIIRRLTGGTTFYADRSWAPVVVISYVPVPEQAIRDRVVIDLVRLAVQYNALGQETFGGRTGYQSISIDYFNERERILGGLFASRGFRFA